VEIRPGGSQPSARGPEEYFTGTVRIDPLIEAPDPARVRAAMVTFEPGARSAWHSHPLGRHWHGATSSTGMTHIAIQEALNGRVVDWMEKVSDEQYRAGASAHSEQR
jgi:quercetin dioxygenase-like cupin family protein